MNRLLAFALVLLPALPALAGGRTLALNTVVQNGSTSLNSGETTITVRTPKSAKLSRSMGGMTGTYVPVDSKLNDSKTARLYKLGAGHYYASPRNALFSIKH